MLVQSLSLALLAFLIGVLPLAAYFGDILLAARWASLPAAFALAFGCWAQVRVMRVHVQREVNRLNWRPASVIDQPPPLPAPEPAEPAVKQVENTRLLIVRDHGNHIKDEPATAIFASDGRPLFPTSRLIEGVPEIDLKYFIELIVKNGHQRSRWLGIKMPSGRKVDPAYYACLIAPLVKALCIVGREERKTGEITCSPQTMKERLGIAP